MSRSPLVTVTGATGRVGGALAERLLQRGVSVRVVARGAERLVPLKARGAEAYEGDLADTPFLIEAFRGADAVFAMIPEHPGAPDFLAEKRRIAESLAEAVKTARVPRVVALSAVGVSPPSGIGPSAANGAFEAMLDSIPGLSVVALRAAFLMENHLASIPLIRQAGINGSPAHADVSLAMIATRDVATVAAEYLATPTFDGHQVRLLLGPRDYTYREATSILGAAIGKPELPYVAFSYEDFRQGLSGAGFSDSTADALVDLYMAFNDGRIQRMVSRTPSSTTPTTLEVFAREIFRPAYQMPEASLAG